MGTLIPLFWTSGDVLPAWVSNPGWIPHLHASSPMHNRCLRFSSGATPADLLTADIYCSYDVSQSGDY